MGRRSSKQSDGSVQTTMATSVFERLRSDILEGVIQPGEKLRIDALRERYRVGASPLREALNRLSAVHLAEQVEQRGFRVTLVSPEQVHELSQTRCLISEIAIREAIAHGDDDWEEEILLSHHRMRKYFERMKGSDHESESRHFQKLHRQFHYALIAACPSQLIRDFHETLFDLSDRVRHLSIKGHPERDVIAEHEGIMKAVVARDTSKATELLNQHFLRTGKIAIEMLPAKGAP